MKLNIWKLSLIPFAFAMIFLSACQSVRDAKKGVKPISPPAEEEQNETLAEPAENDIPQPVVVPKPLQNNYAFVSILQAQIEEESDPKVLEEYNKVNEYIGKSRIAIKELGADELQVKWDLAYGRCEFNFKNQLSTLDNKVPVKGSGKYFFVATKQRAILEDRSCEDLTASLYQVSARQYLFKVKGINVAPARMHWGSKVRPPSVSPIEMVFSVSQEKVKVTEFQDRPEDTECQNLIENFLQDPYFTISETTLFWPKQIPDELKQGPAYSFTSDSIQFEAFLDPGEAVEGKLLATREKAYAGVVIVDSWGEGWFLASEHDVVLESLEIKLDPEISDLLSALSQAEFNLATDESDISADLKFQLLD